MVEVLVIDCKDLMNFDLEMVIFGFGDLLVFSDGILKCEY